MNRRRRRITQLEFPPELASGARLGGKFTGPYSGTMAIWKGRPPVLSIGDDYEPAALVISCTGGVIGSSVTIQFEGGNAWGGVTKREFQIGQGLSVELQAGAFQHVSVRATTPLEAGMEILFSWTCDPVNRSELYQYFSYDLAGLDAVKATALVTVLSCLAGTNIQIGGNDAVGGAAQPITAVNTGAVGGSGNFNVQDGGGGALSATQIAANIVIAINGLANLAGPGGVLATSDGAEVKIEALTGGVAANSKTLTTSNAAQLRIDSGFSGGANNKVNLPEGCKSLIVESACNVTFEIPQFSTTFTRSALAGEEVNAIWGAFSCNQTQNIIFVLRGV
jgi:hypothetical protein